MKLITISAVLALASCTQKQKEPLRQLDKLAGTWQTNNSEADMYEEWTKGKNDVMYGKNYTLNGTDSLVFERVELKKQGNDIFYFPVVRGQDNGQPVPFRLISDNDSSFTFENKEHDFPRRVIYRFIGKDSLVTRIEGVNKGQEEYEESYYRRVRVQ